MKTTQRRLSVKTVLIALVCVVLAALGWHLFDSNVDRSGWVEQNGTHYYRDFHGRKVTGWQEIDGKQYYFGENKAMATSWQDIDGNRYYFAEDGAMQTGWLEENGDRYYFTDDGVLAAGWVDVDGKRYYCAEDGILQTGWLDLDGTRYYLNEDGSMRTGWLDENGKRYFFTKTGAMNIGWMRWEDSTYYCGEDGAAVIGKVALWDANFYFLEDGRMFTGWDETETGRYYYGTDGSMVTGWQEIDGKRYYFEDTGVMYTGWLTQGEYSYYLQEDGSAAVGRHVIDGSVYYFSPKGIHVVLVNASNYVPSYYKVNLVILTEWHQVSDVCLEPLKQMLADCVAAGHQYNFNSAYRTIATQTEILELRTQEYMDAYDLDFKTARARALETVAIPGTSEHHLGLAVDILGDDAIAWLAEHCWDYGFIVRYTAEKSNITGIIDEPWHFRYVGTEVSLDMKDSGLCLEEYLGAVPIEETTNSSAQAE